MKRLIIAVVMIINGYSCLSAKTQYSNEQFTNENYQQSVANSFEFADGFVDFDQNNIPKANLDAADFSVLLQADIAYNQADYAKACDSYYHLAIKYKDPRIIYKGVVCCERIGVIYAGQTRLNQLINLLITKVPNSKVTKLLSIQIGLAKNNFAAAKADLNEVIKSYPDKTQTILLFLATALSNNVQGNSNESLTKFAAYVEDKYSRYPESWLLGVVIYSMANDEKNLLSSFDYINKNYPNWEIPVYWSAGILAKQQQLRLMQTVLQYEIDRIKQPSNLLQNLYIAALINAGKYKFAYNYVESELIKTPQKTNLLINSAILEYKLGDNNAALNSLLKAKTNKTNLNGTLDLAIASLYNITNHKESAVVYYQKVIALNPALKPAANIGIFRAYISSGQYTAADKFIESLAKTARLNGYDAVILKVTLYTGAKKYETAFQIAQQKISLYSNKKTFVYLYASLSGLTKRTQQAIIWYKKYIKLNPKDPAGYNDLSFIYADKTTDYTQAKELAEHAYRLAPHDPAILDTLGWVYYKQGQYDKAVNYLMQAYQLTHDPDTAKHLKAAYLTQGQTDKANKILILDENNEQAQFEQSMLNQAMLILMFYQYGMDLK